MVMSNSKRHDVFALIYFVKGEAGEQTPNLFRGRLLMKKNVPFLGPSRNAAKIFHVKTVFIVTGARALSKNDQSINHIRCVRMLHFIIHGLISN